jgi:hypothetical protein
MTVQDLIDELNLLPKPMKGLDIIFSINTEPGIYNIVRIIDNAKHFGDPVVEIEITESRN